MRFSSFLLLPALALLLCITSTSAQSSVLGVWSLGQATRDTSPYCCVPTSVEIACPKNGACYARFKYPGSMNSKCYAQFKSTSGYTLTLYPTSNSYVSEPTPGGKMNLNFMASSAYNLRMSFSNSADSCDITMQAKEINSGSNSNNNNGETTLSETVIGIPPGGLVLLLLICGSIYWYIRKHRKNQENIITSRNIALAQNPTHLVPNLKFNPVPRPQVQLQQFGQPQPTYNAPGQFIPPHAQVHMNTSGNKSTPGQFVPPKIQASVQENVNTGVKTGSSQLPVPNFQVHLHSGVNTATGQLAAPNFQVHMNNGGGGK